MMNIKGFKEKLELHGFVKFEKVLSSTEVKNMRKESLAALSHDREKNLSKGSHFYLAHLRGSTLKSLLLQPPLQEYIDATLGSTCILHSYNGIVLEPNSKSSVQQNIHRDSPRFCRPYLLSAQILYFLDDFTPENGATWFLPTSHLLEDKPSVIEFKENAIQVTGRAGDAVVFDAMVWHSAGENTTAFDRVGLTQVFSRPFMKQQIDLCASYPQSEICSLTDNQKRLLGYHCRVPKSLEEFLLPEEERLYRANQG